jgi:ATP-dependent helicase/nuclease subunit A
LTTPELLAADDEARRAVTHDLDRTIFLEAGAGSGKTSCLVDRFVALVDKGVPADRIAAITFTEKAAGELLDRIRTALADDADALAVLDRAAIGTLHAFAQRILNEHPIEAGLPPRVQVLDEISSQVAFEARWEQFVDGLLEDPAMERPLRLLFASGARLRHLHDVALAFDDNWDLVLDRLDTPAPAVPPIDVEPILGRIDAVMKLRERCVEEDDKPPDKLAEHLDTTVVSFAAALRDAVDDDLRLELLQYAKLKCSLGKKDNWDGCKEQVVDALADLQLACERLAGRVQEAVLQQLAGRIALFTVAGADARRRAGELEFHDLLVLARSVLRDADHGPRVRAALAARYERLLLDEFQDTDPIQVELAVLIASGDPDATERPWQQVKPDDGRLFFVGDPKQSIYRFRRADIATFLDARDSLVGDSETLTRSFRTVEPIVEWVNHTFGALIQPTPGSQPEYLPLQAVRTEVAPQGPAVAFVGRAHEGDRVYAAELRQAEALDVAAAVAAAKQQRWSVLDDDTEQWRDPDWYDIAILLPARTSLPFLEKAFDDARIPYRAETSSLVYGTREVRDLLMIARAVEDPTDELAVVAALRTPAFACGDDDLAAWKLLHRGRWDHQGHAPDAAPDDHPVARGLRWLGALHRERLWVSPSQLLERIVRERRLMELAVADRRPRDLWRRLRFVLDQCRAWEEAGGVTLRQYLRWVAGLSAEGSRVVETVLPEHDDDAVRILTVHGAKGLEFPIVVLSGMTTELGRNSRGVEVRFPAGAGGWAIKLAKGVSTADFEESTPIEEQMDRHERLRLLYVAATRARDHLVVSTHRRAKPKDTAADLFATHGAVDELVTHLELAPVVAPTDDAPTVERGAELPSLDAWRRANAAALATATRPIAISATRLAAEEAARREAEEEAKRAAEGDPGLKKGPKDIDLPPWQKGRYGTAIGRAVHAVMQVVDLQTGEGLDEAVKAQAAAEGVLGMEDRIEALCRSALASEVVQRAATRPHWREIYVGVPHDTYGVLEGYIDLLYLDDDGYVIVDYKTDAWSTEAELDAKVERYGVQLRAYADAVAGVVDGTPRRSVLVFCGHDEVAQRSREL